MKYRAETLFIGALIFLSGGVTGWYGFLPSILGGHYLYAVGWFLLGSFLAEIGWGLIKSALANV